MILLIFRFYLSNIPVRMASIVPSPTCGAGISPVGIVVRGVSDHMQLAGRGFFNYLGGDAATTVLIERRWESATAAVEAVGYFSARRRAASKAFYSCAQCRLFSIIKI